MDYQKIYDRLIQHRIQNRLEKCGDGTVESHHIKPKCLGGTDDKQNIINLSCREHYVAHLLLAQIYKNTEYFEPLIFALCCMRKTNGRNKRKVFSSRIFQQERLNAIKHNQQKMAYKRSIKITWNGETHTIKEWAKILNIPHNTIAGKYRRGITMDEISKTKPRTPNLIEFNGHKMTLHQWAEKLKISYSNLYNRIAHLGWTVEKAFTTPYMNPSEKHYKRKYFYDGKYYALKELADKYNINPAVLRNRLNNLNMTLEQALTQEVQIQNIHFEYNGIQYKSVNDMLRRLKIPKSYFFKYRKMGYSVVEAIDLTIKSTSVV